MIFRIMARVVSFVGANSFAWRLAGRHLRGGDERQGLTLQGRLTPRQHSQILRGLIARGQANEFAPTHTAVAVRKLFGWRKKLGGYPARAAIQDLLP